MAFDLDAAIKEYWMLDSDTKRMRKSPQKDAKLRRLRELEKKIGQIRNARLLAGKLDVVVFLNQHSSLEGVNHLNGYVNGHGVSIGEGCYWNKCGHH